VQPYIIFSLPRSRSAWLSHLLNCGHDIALDSVSVGDFLRRVDAKGGSCETGAIIGAMVIRKHRPDIRMAVIRRPVADVLHSLRNIGLTPIAGEIEERAVLLNRLATEPGVLAIDFEDLNDFEACEDLAMFCGATLGKDRFEHYSDFNIQLDIRKRVDKLVRTAEAVKRMKQEIAEFGPC
jgi:hypothetical protein